MSSWLERLALDAPARFDQSVQHWSQVVDALDEYFRLWTGTHVSGHGFKPSKPPALDPLGSLQQDVHQQVHELTRQVDAAMVVSSGAEASCKIPRGTAVQWYDWLREQLSSSKAPKSTVAQFIFGVTFPQVQSWLKLVFNYAIHNFKRLGLSERKLEKMHAELIDGPAPKHKPTVWRVVRAVWVCIGFLEEYKIEPADLVKPTALMGGLSLAHRHPFERSSSGYVSGSDMTPRQASRYRYAT